VALREYAAAKAELKNSKLRFKLSDSGRNPADKATAGKAPARPGRVRLRSKCLAPTQRVR
jgi:hypothetical protein